MLHQSKCEKIVKYIKETARPLRIVLFGSAATKKSIVHDLDFLVIVPNGINSRQLAQTLYINMPKVGIAVDLVVVTESQAQLMRDEYWTVVYEALEKGVELYVAKAT
ncbi:MAG: nucleotidyltransferase domain-containing protein [Proteobacteria bacterium]|nr:nucleotidyltransferase domain-containing protein [Pseudomonadota bacterium]